MADYVFATCMPGLEPALKLEVARTRPELRFDASRPGLVTFKSARSVAPDDTPGSVFARVWGRSIGAASDHASAAAQLAGLGATRVHVFARDPDATIDLTAWQGLGPSGPAAIGELVADVIVAPDEPVWLGLHRHDASRPAHPGGTLGIAPSKIEEAIAWAQLPVAANQVALAIGIGFARPGVEVITVEKFGALRVEDLPPRIDWLVVDVNLAPQVALHEVARVMPRLRPRAGAVFMLRVNDWTFVDELPLLVERLRKLGLGDVRMRHLPSNRREICAVVSARSS